MSNAVLPALAGIAWGRRRSAVWSTTSKRSVSGREFRAANWSSPIYRYTLDFDVLRQRWGDAEFAQLLGFINARQGSFDSFLYLDPADNTATDQAFGVGDGTRTQWRLARTLGGYTEPVLGIAAAPTIRVDGVLNALASTSPEALVTFPSPPANGSVLTWSGQFHWRCRFQRDEFDFNELLLGLHELQGLSFVTLKA